MTQWTFRHGLLTGLGIAALSWATLAYAQSQDDEARRRLTQDLAAESGGRVFTGGDIGFRAKGVDRGTPVLVPVVRVDGHWVEVQLGMPGIQRLTK